MDLTIFEFINGLAGKYGALDILGIALAKAMPHFLVLGWLVLFLKEKNWKRRLFFAAFTGLVLVVSRGIIVNIVRFIYDRMRPFEALGFVPLVHSTSPSFPSGHASFVFALAIVVFFFSYFIKNNFSPVWGWWFLGLAFLNGVARVFVGVHWPTDILGGIFVAFLGFSVVYWILRKPLDSLYKLDNY